MHMNAMHLPTTYNWMDDGRNERKDFKEPYIVDDLRDRGAMGKCRANGTKLSEIIEGRSDTWMKLRTREFAVIMVGLILSMIVMKFTPAQALLRG